MFVWCVFNFPGISLNMSKSMPTNDPHVYVCIEAFAFLSTSLSAGSQGYHALKEMLQNGVPGNTILVESDDLRDVGEVVIVRKKEKGKKGGDDVKACCLVYQCHSYKPHDGIPSSITHITAYGDTTVVPQSFY